MVWSLAKKYPEPEKAFTPFLARIDVRPLPLPEVIVVSKPDVHDADGAIQKIITENHFTLAARYQSFLIWTTYGSMKTIVKYGE